MSLTNLDAQRLEDQTLLASTTSEQASTITMMSERLVRFAETEQIQVVCSLDGYKKAEVKACWYSSKEYSKIEKNIVKECDKMAKRKDLKDKKYCSRGLETYQTYMSRKQNYREALHAVLDEQDRQIESNVYDEESIAQVYHNVSSSCQLWATVKGLRDQKEATSYHVEDHDDDDDWEYAKIIPAQPPMYSITPKEKILFSHRTRPMTQLHQVAVSARSA
ncbi:unnamed protein product [Cylindrotheca closterium]|uniref:Uncharacterized protein n=1 Tax=Cylindrotheca closterium TaxID=2856 RepID=A0AAD2CPR6_9STRA|nr:unnamed protein product [Cylindrotheca closterium]